ncbi:MAG: hypothetical protein RRY22_01180 [Bacilli bacterium]
MIKNEKLKEYAGKLMFDMEDSEYETLANEFEVILKQMELIENMEEIKNVEPLFYPFPVTLETLRNDEEIRTVDNQTILKNASKTEGREVEIRKVVE